MTTWTAIKVTKMQAARNQLRTAIDLWFADGDPVSIYTLAFSAYEVIHVISKTKRKGFGLLFDIPIVKEEYRSEWNLMLKRPVNFFKHANRDPRPEAEIEFMPQMNEMFMFFTILGLTKMEEKLNVHESVVMLWFKLHKPHLMTEEGQKLLAESVPVKHLSKLRTIPKKIFFEAVERFIREDGMEVAT